MRSLSRFLFLLIGIRKWSKVSHDFFHELWKSEKAAEAGICLVSVIRVTNDNSDPTYCFWRKNVFGFQDLNEKQLDALRKTHRRGYK